MHIMMVSKRYPRLLSLLVFGTCLHSLDEGDSPSKFRVSNLVLLVIDYIQCDQIQQCDLAT